MKNAHPEDAVLLAFVRGDLSPDEAVTTALHLDDCPHCATRAAGFDPLALAFASVEDPPLPDGLVESILERDALDASRGGTVHDLRQEPLVAFALLAASTLLFVALGQPQEVMASVVSTAQFAGTMASPLSTALDAVTLAWSVLGVCAFVAAVAVAQRRSEQGPS